MKRFLIWLAALTGCGVLPAPAAISVGPNGTGVWTFDSAPAVTDWATISLPGVAASFVSDADIDLAVQSLSAAQFASALPASATMPPSANALARFNTSGWFLQTRPTGVAGTFLLATLQNDTGADLHGLTVTYNFRVANPPEVTVVEEVPGLRAFFSLTGEAGSWQFVPQLTFVAPGFVAGPLPLGSWPAGSQLFLLWADDNSTSDANNSGNEEGAYTIDDFNAFVDIIIVDPLTTVEIYRPISGESFPEGASIRFDMTLRPGLGIPTNVVLYDGTIAVGQTGPLTFPSWMTILYTNATPGLHRFTAVGINSGIALTSAPVFITVVGADRPTLALRASADGADVSWPESFTGFELQSASDLRAPVWEKVPEPDVPSGGFHHVSVDTSIGTRFFRLEKR